MSGTGTPGAQQTQSDVQRLTDWLDDDIQLSNRLGVPHYRNPSELKADIRSLLARLTAAETERDRQVKLGDALRLANANLRDANGMAEARVEALSEALQRMFAESNHDPIGVDVSDYSDEFVLGFLHGQENALCEYAREVGIPLAAALACPPQQTEGSP